MKEWDGSHPYRRVEELEAEIERLRAELAAERERCAKIAEAWPAQHGGNDFAGRGIAAAIRKGEP